MHSRECAGEEVYRCIGGGTGAMSAYEWEYVCDGWERAGDMHRQSTRSVYVCIYRVRKCGGTWGDAVGRG